jgi:hypothetical protein
MLAELFFVLWFFIPAGGANMGAFFSAKIPILKKYSYPVDFNTTFRGKRVLGSHKTVRGFAFGISAAIFAAYLEIFLYNTFSFVEYIIPLDYNRVNPIIFGFLSGFGALTGDAIKSLFKRQHNVQPGKSWFPFDQIDYVLGGIIFTWFYVKLSPMQYILLFFLWFLLHPLARLVIYLSRLRKARYK